MSAPDVVVVGAGNAALCAALAARERGARVLVLERAAAGEAGGNSAYTAGAMRVAYESAQDLAPLLDLTERELASFEFGAYPEDAFLADIRRLSGGRCDPELARTLAGDSLDTLRWMRSQGVGFEPSIGQQAFEVDGRHRFWGGLAVRVRGEGKGLVGALRRACDDAGIEVRHRARALRLRRPSGAVTGVELADGEAVRCGSVVLACGGFEASPEWRVRHLGGGWRRAKVRGTRHNTGDGIAMALEAGAAPAGDWAGCHSVAWDAEAPDVGRLDVAHEYTRNSYQFGVVVNARGERFVDEGADFRNYTYAAYGREVLAQPGGIAWQLFDDKVLELLRREYFREDATVVEAGSIPELTALTEAPALTETVDAFNRAVRTEVPFDPTVLDGRAAAGVTPPKSNWANPLDTPPYRAWKVTCGITFTYGGLRIDEHARVLDTGGRPIPGLYAAGELVGGLWWDNYPGGAGLTAGAVFGRIAGSEAGGVVSSGERGEGDE